MLMSYVRAFETLDASVVVPFYQLPCTFVRPDGVWVVSDHETAVTLAAHLIDHARSQGFARTRVPELKVRRLAAELAMLTGVFVRYDGDDAEIGRFGFTYVARLEGVAWKIVVAIGHDATAASSVEEVSSGDDT
jgi:hypothetical protein